MYVTPLSHRLVPRTRNRVLPTRRGTRPGFYGMLTGRPTGNLIAAMITFACQCGNKLHFENTRCLSCGRKLGYLPEEQVVSALEPLENHRYVALHDNRVYRSCRNYHEYDICNWMVAEHDTNPLCQSCRLTEIIPNLAEPDNITLWYRIEKAKRRLLYTLKQLRLPIEGRDINPANGLAFKFLADSPATQEFNDEVTPGERVMTGHSTGTITINLAEADHSAREEMREQMNERYRTLLGHFRHESAHYYWDRLVRGSEWLGEYRRLFGDETRDYQTALDTYYKEGPPTDWERHWISAYASSHPWEDFAETWAHYLHMIDTLETAHDFGFSVHGQPPLTAVREMQFSSGYFGNISIEDLLADWVRLTGALNAMNRSMGLADAYPFILPEDVTAKLDMIHRLISSKRS